MTKIRWDLPELRHHAEQALQHTGVHVTEDEIRFACADLAAGQLVFKGPDPDSWLVWAPVPPPGA